MRRAGGPDSPTERRERKEKRVRLSTLITLGGRSASLREEKAAVCTRVLFIAVQSLSRVRLSATPWTAARQASLSITSSRSSPKPMSIDSVMPSNHLILCRPLLLLPLIFPSISVFSNESALHIRWPRDWSFSFSTSPSNEHQG